MQFLINRTTALAYFADVDVFTDAFMRLLLSIGSQMFYTALLFTVVSGWVRDRLLEGGLDNDFFVYGFGCDEASKLIVFTLLCSTHMYEIIKTLITSIEIGNSSSRNKISRNFGMDDQNSDLIRITEEIAKIEILGSIIGSFIGLLNEIGTCLPFIITGRLVCYCMIKCALN